MTGRTHSLQKRLLALVVGVVVLVWLAAMVTTWFDARHELDELLDSHLAQAASLLVAQQGGGIQDERAVDAPALHRYAPKVAFQVFHEGRLVLRSANAPARPMIAIGDSAETGFQTTRIDGRTWRVFAAHGAERDVRVYVGEELGSRASILWAVLRSMLWPMLVALPLLALTVAWAIHSGVTPLRKLGGTLAARRPDNLKPVEVESAPAEMAPLIDALNSLFARIASLLDSERRFTADAAHELRTPIAAIQAQAQVAMAETGDGLRRHALQATLEGCDRATRVVEQLLTLSRLEADVQLPQQSVDLAQVAQRVLADLAPKAIGKRQSLELHGSSECWVRGDETLLRVLVRNLVDNAVRYAGPLAQIHVRLERDPERVTLHVEDSGPGLPDADMHRLGERFFRKPGAQESGSGLGWSIVRRIAGAHGARIVVRRSSRLGGLAVDVGFAAALHSATATAPADGTPKETGPSSELSLEDGPRFRPKRVAPASNKQ
jgi:two-component system, OmpR family, sensor histidine kinase QseC